MPTKLTKEEFDKLNLCDTCKSESFLCDHFFTQNDYTCCHRYSVYMKSLGNYYAIHRVKRCKYYMRKEE